MQTSSALRIISLEAPYCCVWSSCHSTPFKVEEVFHNSLQTPLKLNQRHTFSFLSQRYTTSQIVIVEWQKRQGRFMAFLEFFSDFEHRVLTLISYL